MWLKGDGNGTTGWRRRGLMATVGAAALGAAVLGPQVAAQSGAELAQAPAAPAASIAPASFADLAERVKPAVVNISTTQKIEQQRGPNFRMPQLPPGMPGEEFFRRFFEQQQAQPAPQEVSALGSGFIIDAAGYVVTNNHVVGEASEITVILNDGTQLPATIRGRDPKTDLALLKVESKQPLPFVRFGDSDKARIGDWIVAVGNPFGLGGTVTAGIISATGRNISAGPYDDFLQTDASINRGNSGGPMFNLQGEVIGINTAIFSPTGGNIGIGFAVPSSMAQQVIAELREKGTVERGWLGVHIQDVTPEIANALGLEQARGALVADVNPDTPAARAGFQQGDLIVGFAGKPIKDARQLPREVAAVSPGQEVQVTVIRRGKEMPVKVTIAAMPGEEDVAQAAPAAEGGEGQLGMALAELSPEMRAQLNLGPKAGGAVVADVAVESEAARKGIRPGDVIVAINQEPVGGPADVVRQVQEAKKAERKSVLLLINREGDQRFVALNLA